VSRTGVKAIVWMAVVIAVAMVLATASPAFDRNESLALFLGACVLLVAAVLWNMRVMPAIEAREEEASKRRAAELKQQIVLTGQPVEISRRGHVLLMLFLGCVVLASVHRALVRPDGEATVMIAISLLLAVLAWWYWPWLRKPGLIVRRDGIETAPYGFLRWEEIESIDLRNYTTHGFTSHLLHLHVPTLQAHGRRLGFLDRARLGMTRGAEPNFVVIPLGFDTIQCEAIHALCYELWHERTGRTSVSTTAPTPEMLEMKRRADELAALERVASAAETDPEKAMRMLDEFENRFPADAPSRRPKLGRAAQARMDRLMAELRTVDPRDRVALKHVVYKHAKEGRRRREAIALIAIIVILAVVVSVAVLRF